MIWWHFGFEDTIWLYAEGSVKKGLWGDDDEYMARVSPLCKSLFTNSCYKCCIFIFFHSLKSEWASCFLPNQFQTVQKKKKNNFLEVIVQLVIYVLICWFKKSSKLTKGLKIAIQLKIDHYRLDVNLFCSQTNSFFFL